MNRPLPKRPFEVPRRPLTCPPPNWAEVYRELGLGVTICIAATTDEDAIVTVSDRMISFGDGVQAPDNAALKALQISQRWGVLYTADDVGPVYPLVRNIRNRLRDIKNDEILSGLDTLNLRTVKKVICQEYTAIFHQQIVERFLLRYGFSELQQFREVGLQQFGETKFLSILEEIDRFDLGVGLLVYGFDPVRGSPHIFEVKSPGMAVDHDILGYAVIGSGFWPALSALHAREVTKRGIAPTMYRLCEAKFCSETAAGVGRETVALVFNSEGKFNLLHPKEIKELRRIWEGTRRSPIPPEGTEIIANRFKKLINTDDDGTDT